MHQIFELIANVGRPYTDRKHVKQADYIVSQETIENW